MVIDWQQLVLNLRKHYTTEQIAKKVGVCRTAIQNMASGIVKDPCFTTGVSLINLHFDTVQIEKHKKLLVKP